MEQTIKKFNLIEAESRIIEVFISANESDLGVKLITEMYKSVEDFKGDAQHIREWEKRC